MSKAPNLNLLHSARHKTSFKSAQSTAVQAITNAQPPLSQEQNRRQRTYFLSMMLRTVCFIATILIKNEIRWVALAGALILPYVAVVLANAATSTRKTSAHFSAKRLSLPNKSAKE